MKKFNAILAGLGIGTAAVGIGATVAGLVVASKKAKEHDMTTTQYIKGKAKQAATTVKNKAVQLVDKCPNCNMKKADCICDDDYDPDQLMFDDIDLSDDEVVFEEEEDDINSSEDMFAKVLAERDEFLAERDEWKRRYDELAAILNDETKEG